MQRLSFNDDWTVKTAETAFADLFGTPGRPVTLPHDAIRDQERSESTPEGANTGFFPGGYFHYSKSFEVPSDYRRKSVSIEFEGVYRDAVVYINGDFAAQRPNGYSRFVVPADAYLKHGELNTIRVEARAHLDSRWYSGAGIYRDVHLIVGEPVHLAIDGVRITTPDIDDELATVVVAARVENEERLTRHVRVTTVVLDSDGEIVAQGTTPLTLLPRSTETARLRVHVTEPKRWHPDAPHLYVARTTVTELDGSTVDDDATTFGIRSLSVDPVRGLRINGERVTLRGACVHHDHGPLGAAAVRRAEVRRIEILKTAGFNAIRSSHNPLSVAALDACDRLGMLVMDESFDIWTQAKTPYDYSLAFPEWWERDLESMVAKDFNHPSVIMYSIGNEIYEVGRPIGSTWTRKLAEKVRALDPTRFVTNAINGLVASSDELPNILVDSSEGPNDVNLLIATMSEEINQLGASTEVSGLTEESHAAVDIAGLNYCDARYVPDRTDYPNRVVLGTETFPSRIDVLWPLVENNPHVLGDFTWTAWDYLGESGVGRIDYPDENYVSTGFLGGFPQLTAGCGDIDITGHRTPISHYREIAFGLQSDPYIAVHRPERHGQATVQTPWSWVDALPSWSWDAADGDPVTVDVYSDADEVELTLDGAPLARVVVGAAKALIARFETTYTPGELTAISYRDGAETGRRSLRSASRETHLDVLADRTRILADDGDLAYVDITLRDEHGVLLSQRDRKIEVRVEGEGELVGLGTGSIVPSAAFDSPTCTTFNGRALAIVRPTGAGSIRIRVSADGCETTQTIVESMSA